MILTDTLRPPYELKGKAVLYLFLFLIGMAFAAIHLDTSPAQSQLSCLVWLLPLTLLSGVKLELTREEKLFMLFGALMFLSAILSSWNSGDISDPVAIRTYWLYLLPIGLVVTLCKIQISRQWL